MSVRAAACKLPSPSQGHPIQISTHHYEESIKNSRNRGEGAIPSSVKFLHPKALFFWGGREGGREEDQYLLPVSNDEITD